MLKSSLTNVRYGVDNKKMKKLGDIFTSRGNVYTICGWKPKSFKYPLLAKKDNGKTFKFPAEYAEK